MLQQTQVKTVLPRYEAWFDHFPDIATLAAAPLDSVLKSWEGLGYYRRARFIHQAAQQIAGEHAGTFPTAFDEIIALPGIGRSTAGAIASFCFGAHTPVLDGNVKRVLKRWHGQPQANDRALWPLAQQAIDTTDNPACWNQAMMELGATICGAKSATCAACPVNHSCASAFAVTIAPETARPVRDLHWRVQLHICPERGIWLTQRPESGIWAGLWTPPISELDARPEEKPRHIHLLTHRRLHLYPQQVESEPVGEGRWAVSVEGFALPTGIHHLLEKIV